MKELDASRFLLRRALPLTVGITALVAVARWFASDRDVIGQETGVAIMALLTVVLLGVVSLWAATALRESARLRRSVDRAALYRLIAENAPGGAVYVYDRDLRYQLVEGQNLEAVGLVPSELEGRTIWEVLEPETCERIEPIYRAALEGRKSAFEMEFRGHEYRVTVAPLYDDDGSVSGGLVQTRQITEQRQLEAQLRQAQKLEAVGQLAGGIAHDFNNLLTVIAGYTTLALARPGVDDELRETLGQISSAAERATDLTRQLLAFSRKQLLEPRRVDLGSVVEEILPMLDRLIESRIELRAAIQPDVAPVLFDPGQLEQILVNLVVNARDAMPDGGTIAIEVSEAVLDEAYVDAHPAAVPGRHAVLTVSDNGDGMDEATRARIFEPFFTTKEPGHGTGLGLAVVHGIVRRSGGNIWVYSEVGRGTTFKIYLPAAPGAVAGENGSSPVEPEPAGARPGTAVLVVDDHRAVRMLTVAVLEAAGYEVFEAASSEEAAAILGRHTVDAVISDVVMPGGTADAPSYPDDARGHTPPVVYMSGYTADVAVRSKLVGTDARFLEKPFAPAALLSATASAVNT